MSPGAEQGETGDKGQRGGEEKTGVGQIRKWGPSGPTVGPQQGLLDPVNLCSTLGHTKRHALAWKIILECRPPRIPIPASPLPGCVPLDTLPHEVAGGL